MGAGASASQQLATLGETAAKGKEDAKTEGRPQKVGTINNSEDEPLPNFDGGIDRRETPSSKIISSIQNLTTPRKTEGQSIQEMYEQIAMENNKPIRATTKDKFGRILFRVELGAGSGLDTSQFPKKLLMRVTLEAVELLTSDGNIFLPILVFPFDSIVSSNCTRLEFEMHVAKSAFSFVKNDKLDGATCIIVLKTYQSKQMEELIRHSAAKISAMASSNCESKLMDDNEFHRFLPGLVEMNAENDSYLNSHWRRELDTALGDRQLLGKQALELMLLVSPTDPFERIEFACYLYEKLFAKDSFPLVLNLSMESEERVNILMRLNLLKGNNV
jgi:hypothetical protein